MLFLLFIQNYKTSSFAFVGTFNAIDNLEYNPINNEISYYDTISDKEKIYSIDNDSWRMSERNINPYNKTAFYDETIIYKSIKIIITQNTENKDVVIFKSMNTSQTEIITVNNLHRMYYFDDVFYIISINQPNYIIKDNDSIDISIFRIKIDFTDELFNFNMSEKIFIRNFIPAEYNRGNVGFPELYQDINKNMILITIPAIIIFNWYNENNITINKYDLPKGKESFNIESSLSKTSSDILLRFRVNQINITNQHYRIVNQKLVKMHQFTYSAYPQSNTGPAVFINSTTIIASEYTWLVVNDDGKEFTPQTPMIRWLNKLDGEYRSTQWLYFINFEKGIKIPISIPDNIARDGYIPQAYILEYMDYLLPFLTAILTIIITTQSIIQLYRKIRVKLLTDEKDDQ